jgi:uncharacterized damage-inducible protein DinB
MRALLSRSVLRSAVAGVTMLTASVAGAQATDPAFKALRDNWDGMVKNITAAAEEVSEADYAFRPVATVRTFGEIIGHVAGSQNLICATVLGDKPAAEDAIEKSAKTKAALVAALKASSAYCARAYAIAASKGGDAVTLFGGPNTRLGALALNAVHDGEHYGNIVTYMRMKGMVPPSSKR